MRRTGRRQGRRKKERKGGRSERTRREGRKRQGGREGRNRQWGSEGRREARREARWEGGERSKSGGERRGASSPIAHDNSSHAIACMSKVIAESLRSESSPAMRARKIAGRIEKVLV